MKYRHHRGSLVDSMATMVEVDSMEELIAELRSVQLIGDLVTDDNVEIKEYGDGPDERIGWARTCIVLVDGNPFGFSDGMFDE